jgi:Protein of Unknown function (DUF2784)
MNPYLLLATAVLMIHLTWILWVIFGWLICRDRPWLRWLHFAALIYGVFIEVAPWPCPLTLLEQYLEALAGIAPYRGPFVVHYLDALIYPDVPDGVLISLAVAVCAANMWLHIGRLRRRPARL